MIFDRYTLLNLHAVLAIVAGIGVGWGCHAAGLDGSGSGLLPGMLIFGAVMAVDLAIRFRNRARPGAWLRPGNGGHVFFIPVWLLAALTGAGYALVAILLKGS